MPQFQLWIIINDLNYEVFENRADSRFGYQLKRGDIIRFGRVRFLVKRISSEPNDQNSFHTSQEGISEEDDREYQRSNDEESNIGLQRSVSINPTQMHDTIEVADNLDNQIFNHRRSDSSVFFEEHNEFVLKRIANHRRSISQTVDKKRSASFIQPGLKDSI